VKPKAKYRRWFLTVIASLIAVRLLIVLINYTVDPFDVFGTGLLLPVTPNERFLKTEYLIENPGKYNTYIMGSSRSNLVSCNVAEKYLMNSNCYHLTVTGGSWLDNWYFLNNLIKSGTRIDNLIIITSFDVWRFHGIDKNYQKKLHPIYTGETYFDFYFEYLKIVPLENIIRKVLDNINGAKIQYNLPGDGTFIYSFWDRQIADNHEEYILSEKSFHENLANREKSHLNAKYHKINIKMLKQFSSALNKLNIKTLVLVAPNNYNRLNKFNTLDYLNFLQKLFDGGFSEIWDFNGYNSITLDNRNYYEQTHFRPHVGELMLAKIFNDTAVDVPADFGVKVTRENLYVHIDNIISQFKWADKKFSQ
jgi:hypothetical protein